MGHRAGWLGSVGWPERTAQTVLGNCRKLYQGATQTCSNRKWRQPCQARALEVALQCRVWIVLPNLTCLPGCGVSLPAAFASYPLLPPPSHPPPAGLIATYYVSLRFRLQTFGQTPSPGIESSVYMACSPLRVEPSTVCGLEHRLNE